MQDDPEPTFPSPSSIAGAPAARSLQPIIVYMRRFQICRAVLLTSAALATACRGQGSLASRQLGGPTVGCRLGLGARPWVHSVFIRLAKWARAIVDLKEQVP